MPWILRRARTTIRRNKTLVFRRRVTLRHFSTTRKNKVSGRRRRANADRDAQRRCSICHRVVRGSRRGGLPSAVLRATEVWMASCYCQPKICDNADGWGGCAAWGGCGFWAGTLCARASSIRLARTCALRSRELFAREFRTDRISARAFCKARARRCFFAVRTGARTSGSTLVGASFADSACPDCARCVGSAGCVGATRA